MMADMQCRTCKYWAFDEQKAIIRRALCLGYGRWQYRRTKPLTGCKEWQYGNDEDRKKLIEERL